MTTAVTPLRVREARPDDDAAILRLLTDTMAGGPTGERTAAFYDWKHRQNPFGTSLALVAEIDGRLAGLRMFMRWRFVWRGRVVRAVRAVDTATHPDFQGRGVFTTLTRAALALAAADTDMVFNTPNANSLPGYLKMGWSPVGRVPVAVRVVRPVAFALRARGVDHGEPSEPPPAVALPPAAEVLADQVTVQGLLDQSDRPDDRLRTDRDAGYLHWRYAQAPALGYRALPIREGDELAGLAIGRPRRRGSLAELTLSEVIVRAGDRRTARRLLRGVARRGVDHVATHLGGWPTADAARRAAGYLHVPGQGMTLVAKPMAASAILTSDVGPALTLDGWALSLGDLEVF